MERQKVISKNLRPLSHPYYYAYRDLQRLCMRILRHEEMKYGADDNQIHGILFDGAWLWEEYLNTFLSDYLVHPRNKTGEGKLKLFKDGTVDCYPDFYNKEFKLVLDAKYKGYKQWSNVQNPDLYQVMAYMHILEADKGGFLVPIEDERLKTKTLCGRSGSMSVIGMRVQHHVENFLSYRNYMEEQERRLVEEIISYTNIRANG